MNMPVKRKQESLGCVLIQATVAKALVRVQGKARGVPFGRAKQATSNAAMRPDKTFPEG